jgi:hypothetical protein
MRKVPKEQIIKSLQQQNPWWNPPYAVPTLYTDCRPRSYLKLFLSLVVRSEVRRAVVLMGPRRVGKTYLIHHVVQQLLATGIEPHSVAYFAVDQPLFNGLGMEELVSHYREAVGKGAPKERVFVFFDEIQYMKDWEIHLKSLVDTYVDLRVAVSGSAAAALRLGSTESGAGRFTDFVLPPLTFQEYLMLLNLEGLVQPSGEGLGSIFQTSDITALNRHFLNYLNFGGYPEVIFSPEIQAAPERFIKSDIIDKVLLRDLPSLYGIQDIQELNSLFTVLSYNTANEVSLEKLSEGSGVAKNTIKRYIEYLEAAFLIRKVHRIDRNARRFKRATSFKVYLTNPSIRAALFSPIEENDSCMGDLVETAVFSQWFHSESVLHYARWKNGEVDIVKLDHEQKPLWVVEAKWSDRIAGHPDELSALCRFCKANGLTSALVTTRSERTEMDVEGVRIVFRPASLYCYTVGRNLVEHRTKGGTGAGPS